MLGVLRFLISFVVNWFRAFSNVYYFNQNYFSFLTDVVATTPPGVPVRFNLGPTQCVLLTKPEEIRQYYKDHIGIRVDALTASMRKVIGQNIITASNEEHPEYRHRYVKYFDGPSLRKYAEMTQQVIAANPPAVGKPFVVQDYVARVASTAAIASFSGIDVSEIPKDLGLDVLNVFKYIRKNMTTFLPSFGVPRDVIESRTRVYDFIESLIPRFANTDTVLGSIIDFVVSKYPPSEQTTKICEELFSLYLGGSETTVSLLAWICYYLATNPDVQIKLREELSKQELSYDTKSEFPYLNQVITEVLRLRSPTGLGCLLTTEKVCFPDFSVEPGTLVFVSPLITHLDSKYHEDPEVFRPERHSKHEDLSGKYFPFGMFHYYCLGKEFSKHEARLLTKCLLSFGEIKLVKGSDEFEVGITVKPRDPIVIEITTDTQANQ